MRPKTYVLMILDKSGSMSDCQHACKHTSCKRALTIQSFNEKLQHYKEESKEQDLALSFYTFNGHVYEHLFNIDPTNIPELTWEDYCPDGSTAMLDAMGYAITKLKEETEDEAATEGQDIAFFVELFSDGYENASQKYPEQHGGREAIAEIIKSCQKTNKWTFAYVGSDQDLAQVKKFTKDLGIPAGNVGVIAYAAGSPAVGRAYGASQNANVNFLRARRMRTDERGVQIRGQAVSASLYNSDDEIKNLSEDVDSGIDLSKIAVGTLGSIDQSALPSQTWNMNNTADVSSNTNAATPYQVPHRAEGSAGLPGKRVNLKK